MVIIVVAVAAVAEMHEIVIELVVMGVATWMVVDIIVREDMLVPIFAAPEVEDIPMAMDVAEEMLHLAATTT